MAPGTPRRRRGTPEPTLSDSALGARRSDSCCFSDRELSSIEAVARSSGGFCASASMARDSHLALDGCYSTGASVPVEPVLGLRWENS